MTDITRIARQLVMEARRQIPVKHRTGYLKGGWTYTKTRKGIVFNHPDEGLTFDMNKIPDDHEFWTGSPDDAMSSLHSAYADQNGGKKLPARHAKILHDALAYTEL